MYPTLLMLITGSFFNRCGIDTDDGRGENSTEAESSPFHFIMGQYYFLDKNSRGALSRGVSSQADICRGTRRADSHATGLGTGLSLLNKHCINSLETFRGRMAYTTPTVFVPLRDGL